MTAAVVAGLFQTSCLEEYAPGSYYTFTGETVAGFLTSEDRAEYFTDFVYILKKANVWGELETYGEHTCFAPTNEAVATYLAERNYTSVEEIPVSLCDTIAKTHLCNTTFYCKDLEDGTFPAPNLLDRYLIYSTDSSLTDAGKYKVVYKVNKAASIIERDDTVQNGVVHVIDKVISPSNSMLPDVIELDSTATLFYDALLLTRLTDSLSVYIDNTYPAPDYDSTYLCLVTTGKTSISYKTGEETERGIFPDKRTFKFTAFIPQNSTLETKYGVTDLDGLRTLALSIYGDKGAEYSGPLGTDNDTIFANRKNSLNKFISYHLLPMQLSYDKLNLIHKNITNNNTLIKWDEIDVEDIYETMLPHSIFRVSTPKVDQQHRYINRKGTEKSEYGFIPGVKVIPTDIDATAINGEYHYVDDILKYDEETRTDALNTRLRIMCNTMSPDFINSNASGRVIIGGETNNDRYTVGFKKGFAKNVACSDATKYFVRYANTWFGCFLGYEMTIMGIYDIAFKLPPVPSTGTYEIRFLYNTMAGSSTSAKRGTVQVYFLDGDVVNGDLANTTSDWKPCGIPINLGIAGDHPSVGNIKDADLDGEDEIQAVDKAMRARGYMKAMDSYYSNDGNGSILRNEQNVLRRILTTEYMEPEKNYWIRIRVCSGKEGDCPFNVLEIVPKSIYAGDIPEDRH